MTDIVMPLYHLRLYDGADVLIDQDQIQTESVGDVLTIYRESRGGWDSRIRRFVIDRIL